MSRLNRDTVVAVFLLLFCVVFYAASLEIEETTYATIGAEIWPQLILGLLFVLSLIYLFQSVGGAHRGAHRQDSALPGPAGFFARYRNAIWCYGLFLAFLLTLDIFGMLIGGILFVFAALSVLGRRTPKMMAIHATVAVVSVGAMWSVFTFALRVILPEGIVLHIY